MANKKSNFFNNMSNFFKKVDGSDLMKFTDNGIKTFDTPISRRELDKKRELQVFRQYLQSKNWTQKHIELYDEYRRMDNTFPIINAAIRLYGQEVCLTGDTIVTTPGGDKTIRELYNTKKDSFYVKSFDKMFNRVEWNEATNIQNNGVKPVFKVTVARNISYDSAEWDNKLEASFKCTDNHEIMVGPGLFKQLKDLRVGDKIWSMYYSVDPACSCKVANFNTTVIESIESAGEEEVFDLVHVVPNHHFMIKLTDSFYVSVHNCTKDTDGNVIKIITEDKRIKKLLEDCFYKNLKINSTSYYHVRSLLKFGNHYSFLDTRQGVGVLDLIHLPPESIRIQLLDNSASLDDFKYTWYGHGLEFEPWEIVHWKNIEDLETEPYGQSILRSIVDTYRRIILMREAMIIYRITRAPQRLLFKIDTTGLGADDALRYAAELKKQMMKRPLVNPMTGELDYKHNPISIMENLYMPTVEGDTSDVRVLEGATNMGDLEDYKIIKDDLFAGLLIPKSYLTFEEDLCLRENTKILTTDGVLTIGEISRLLESDEPKKIYSLSSNKYGIILSGKILWCKKTKVVDMLYRITINGKHIVESTDNHPFMLENLSYRRADELKIGDRLKNIFDEDYYVSDIEVLNLDVEEYVYDLEVDEYHNFALESGVFVHNSNKAALAQEDLRFAGAIRQYQGNYIEGLLHIALVHLHMNGCSQEELGSFQIQMNINSTLAEKTKNELLQQRIDLVKSAWDPSNPGLNVMSYTDSLKELLHYTDEEIEKTFKDQMIEKKINWRLSQLNENGFYEEPASEQRKASLLGMSSENNVFSNLNFEGVDSTPDIKRILTEKLNMEINALLHKVTASPSLKMIESVISENYNYTSKLSKTRRNAIRVKKELGLD